MARGARHGPLAAVLAFARFGGREAVTSLVLIILGGLVEGIGLAFLIPVLALLTGQGGKTTRLVEGVFGRFGSHTALSKPAILIGLFVLLLVIRGLIILARDRSLNRLQIRYSEAIRLRVITAIGAADWQHIAALRHARITQAVGIDVPRMGLVAQYLLLGASALATLLVQAALALLIAPLFAMAAMTLFALGGALMTPLLRRAGRSGSLLSERYMEMFNAIGQLLGGAKLAVAQNMRSAFVGQYESAIREVSAQQLAFAGQQSRLSVVTSTATALLGATLLAVGVAIRLDPGTMLVSIVILMRMAAPAATLQQSAVQFANVVPARAAIEELIGDLAPPPDIAAVADRLPEAMASITFDAVTFTYPNSDAGLYDLSVHLEAGEFIGVTGSSGAGKTTFIDLLAGLYLPASGQILSSGMILSPGNVEAWRERIAYVAQDGYLFNDTLRNNLKWGSDASDERIWEALECAAIASVVRSMAGGLDTMVSERGGRLSGGERQRVAIARAVLRRPDILVLDEATNAIDEATEMVLLENLRLLAHRPTIVLVAHQSNALAKCDRILCFANGRLSQS